MNLLPDLAVGTFEVRDLLSLLMTGLGAYLAFRAIRMGTEQAAIAKRQMELDIEQGKISARQAQIAEYQHEAFQRQAAKKAELVLECGTREKPGLKKYVQFLTVSNVGNKAATSFAWQLTYDLEFESRLKIRVGDGLVAAKDMVGSDAVALSGTSPSRPLLPDDSIEIGVFERMPRNFRFHWTIRTEDDWFTGTFG